MIKFKISRNDDGKIEKLKVTGHSGYADKGADIVCAAVSTACQMTVNGITELGLAKVHTKARDGFLECEISPKREDGADLLLESLMITVYEIAKQYNKYLFVTEV